MHYLEKEQIFIRNNWFKDHEIIHHSKTEDMERVVFGKPGTGMYQLEIILSGPFVFIAGDLGEAVYRLTEAADFERMLRYDVSYFTGKLSTSSRGKIAFSQKDALIELKEYFIEHNEVKSIGKLPSEILELYKEIRELIETTTTTEEFSTYLYSLWQRTDVEWFCSEVASDISSMGQLLSNSIIAYWVAIEMIGKIFKKDDKKL